MSHATIAGMTQSGKTYLAQQLARGICSKGVPVLALHKPREPWGKGCTTWQTPDPEQFLSMFDRIGKENGKTGKSCATFMELSDAVVDKYDSRFHLCFTQGRHDGFRCHFVTQRAAFVHPAIRENCTAIYLFNCTPKAADVWVEEFNDERLSIAADLPPHYFVHKEERFAPARLWEPIQGKANTWKVTTINEETRARMKALAEKWRTTK